MPSPPMAERSGAKASAPFSAEIIIGVKGKNEERY